jgi:hypothetical protein
VHSILALVQVPTQFVAMAQLPMTATGKLSRRDLPDAPLPRSAPLRPTRDDDDGGGGGGGTQEGGDDAASGDTGPDGDGGSSSTSGGGGGEGENVLSTPTEVALAKVCCVCVRVCACAHLLPFSPVKQSVCNSFLCAALSFQFRTVA